MKTSDLYKVQVVTPAGNVYYLTPDFKESSCLADAETFADSDAAEERANLYREACRGQNVIIMVVPLIEED